MIKQFPHEREDVQIIPSDSRSCAELWPLLKMAGFTQQHDVWSLRRRGDIPNGQSDGCGTVSIFDGDEELYLDEEEIIELGEEAKWDKIEISYLLASLPEQQIESFVNAVSTLSTALQIPLIYEGQQFSSKELQEKFQSFCRYLDEEYGGAGSKTIQHFIDIHYSR
ncbi:MAG TPA: hypothetical protein VGB45_06935 [Abditibacterium sp.]|jgi:hypothetical protein